MMLTKNNNSQKARLSRLLLIFAAMNFGIINKSNGMLRRGMAFTASRTLVGHSMHRHCSDKTLLNQSGSLSCADLETLRKQSDENFSLFIKYFPEIYAQSFSDSFVEQFSEKFSEELAKGVKTKVREIARNLKALNLPEAVIAEATGLSINEVIKLK